MTNAVALPTEIYDRLKSARFSPGQRRIARYIIDHRDSAAFLTSDSIARQVGVSQPSVSRFAAALGYERFADFKQALQDWARSEMSVPNTLAQPVTPLDEAIAVEIANLQWLAQSSALTAQISRVGEFLMDSPRLPVVGLRISRSFAYHFAYLGTKIHSGIMMVDRSDTEAKELISRAKHEGATWCLVFMLPRYPREGYELVEYARGIGLKVAILTDESFPALGLDADELLTVRLGSGLLFDTSAALNLMSSAILHSMVDARPALAQDLLERFERDAASLQVFEG